MSENKKRILENIRECFFGFFELHLAGSAAELSYYFLFSVFSIIMATATLAFSAGMDESVFGELTNALVPELVSEMLEDYHQHIGTNGIPAGVSLGLFLSLYSVARYVKCLKQKIRMIYGKPGSNSFLKEWAISFVLALFVIFGFYFTFVLQTVGTGILKYISEEVFFIPHGIIERWFLLRFAAIGVYAFILLTLAYKAIPGTEMGFSDVRVGALFSTVAWIFVSVVFSFYADNVSDYSANYGSMGAFVALMLWLHLMNSVILTGALINKTMYDQRAGENRKIFL